MVSGMTRAGAHAGLPGRRAAMEPTRGERDVTTSVGIGAVAVGAVMEPTRGERDVTTSVGIGAVAVGAVMEPTRGERDDQAEAGTLQIGFEPQWSTFMMSGMAGQ